MATSVPRATVLGLRALTTVFHTLATLVTMFRVIHRKRRKQYSWDDGWALAAVLFNLLVFICLWIRIVINDRAKTSRPITSIPLKEFTYVSMSIGFTCTIWAARISIACSISRILPNGRSRLLVLCMTWIFLVTAIVMIIIKNWYCGHINVWIDCPLSEALNLLKLCTDLVSDAALITVPLYILWHTSLPKAPRYMIRAVFATSILTTCISVVHVVYAMGNNDILDGITANLESAVTILVCNLLVVVTYIYRRIRNGRDLDEELTEYLSTENTHPRSALTAGVYLAHLSTRSQPTTSLSTISHLHRGTSIFLEATEPYQNHGDHSLLHELSLGTTGTSMKLPVASNHKTT